jgi:hypothetical protein
MNTAHFASTGTLMPGTALRIGQRVDYLGSIVALRPHGMFSTGHIVGPKRKLIVVDFGPLGEFECKPENLVATEEHP